MEAHLVGAFPRSEALVEVTRAASRGRISQHDLDTAFNREIEELGNLQSQAGLNLFVDGQLNWKDLFRPFCDLLTGIRPGALTRWFDNNTFYRKPVVSEKVSYRGDNLNAYFRQGLLPNGARKKAILPGPYTFALLSENNAYSSLQDLVDDLAHSLASIIDELKKAGYEYFQFNEPCICFGELSKNDVQSMRHAYEVLTKGVGAKTALHTYFGDASSRIDSILDLPIDYVGIDFYATSIETLVEHDFNKAIGCGCIDARNSLLESPDVLRKLIERVLGDLGPPGIYLAPNSDLDFLPYSIALKKIQILSETKKSAD